MLPSRDVLPKSGEVSREATSTTCLALLWYSLVSLIRAFSVVSVVASMDTSEIEGYVPMIGAARRTEGIIMRTNIAKNIDRY
jgi:hypothetical protein